MLLSQAFRCDIAWRDAFSVFAFALLSFVLALDALFVFGLVCVGSGSFCHDWASHCSVLF